MSNEIQVSYAAGKTVYSIIHSVSGQLWNTGTVAFETFVSGNYPNYAISMTEQGVTGYYVGNFPSAIVAGTYNVIARQQMGGTAAQTDPTIGTGDINWNGTGVAPLSDTATSGQVGQFLPIRFFRGQMIKPFVFPLVSSTDHITPFTSGVVSGSYSQDGGNTWTAFSSGAYTEMGNGFFSLQAIVSGELVCNALAMVFQANGISGGQSDPRNMVLFTQRVSGQ